MFSLDELQKSVRINQAGNLELDLSSQDLSSVPAAVFQLTELQALDLSNNPRITQLPAELHTLDKLVCLRLSGCVSLKELPASGCFPCQLEELHLDRCELTEIGSAITDLRSLRKLNLSNNPIGQVPETLPKLVDLRELGFSGCQLTNVEDLTRLKDLEKLDLSENPVKAIPSTVGRLTRLKELHLKDCQLFEMISEITQLSELEKLDLSWNPIKIIPSTISRLTRLKELHLWHCQLSEVTSEITQLRELETLGLSFNSISSIPCTISRLSRLKNLYLRDCELSEMEYEITKLTQLETLDLSVNLIKKIPSTIKRLTRLKELHLWACQLSEIASEITQLSELERLNLSLNPIKTIPSTINRLTRLKELHLWGCQLSQIASELTQLSELEKLYLGWNPISSVPNVEGKLKSLRMLDLSNCGLKDGLESLFDMTSLVKLDLSYNQLMELPVDFLDLKGWQSYEELIFDGNPLVVPPLSVCNRGTKAIFNYLLEYKVKTTVHLKVVLVGSSRAGKTSLVKTLTSGMPTLVEEDDRTIVLERSNWDLRREQRNVNIQIVDFGGQEWYKVVHPFFLDQDALILLAVSLGTYSRENFGRDVGSWLHVLQSRAPKAEVRFVLTQADQVKKEDVESKIEEIRQFASQGEGSNALEQVRVVSSKTMENIKELQEEIVQLAIERGKKIPLSWLSLYRELCLAKDAETKQFWLSEDVKKMVQKKYNVIQKMLKTTEQRCRDVLSFLHSTGLITWYEHPPELSNYVFHRPEYLAELLRAVFADHHATGSLSYENRAFNAKFDYVSFEKEKESFLHRGVMSAALLRGLWAHLKLDEGMFSGLVQLLVQFDLCYVLSRDGEGHVNKLRFPWFLREAAGPEVSAVLQSVPGPGCFRLTLEFRFAAMCPPPLYEKFAARMHHRIQDTDSRRDWQDGVLARIFSSRVVVQRERSAGDTVISIAVEGEDLVELWEVLLSLKEDMTSLLAEWPGAKFQSWLVCPHCVQCAVQSAHRFPGEYTEKGIPWRQRWMTCPRGSCDVPACLVFPVQEHKRDIQQHLDALEKFTCRLEKQCEPAEQVRDACLLDAPSVPSFKTLNDLSKEIVPYWQSLGRQLGVEEWEIESITYSLTCLRPEEKAFEMLKCWRKNLSESSAGNQKLARALRREDLGRLADKSFRCHSDMCFPVICVPPNPYP